MTVDAAELQRLFPHLSAFGPPAAGGQKLVYRCQHQSLGPCALKLIRPGAEPRLDRELEAVRRIQQVSSDHVPRVFDVGKIELPMVGQIVWLLEQFIDGVPLSDLMLQGSLGKDRTLNLGLDLLSATTDAESVNLVHRDIKPPNIVVDSHGKAWLLDFGIVRILDLTSITPSNQMVGPHSPGYSAPEQFNYSKRDIDSRSDLFAIGVILYQSAVGVNPFLAGARDRQEVLRRVLQDPLPRLHLPWDTRGEFADLVAVLTQKYPYQRPRTSAEALAWLQDIADHLGGI